MSIVPASARPSATAKLLAAALFLPGLAGCQGASADDDAQRINRTLLRLLTSDGRRICVDGKTYGEPLAIFRAMLPAPDPARRPLGWHQPTPLEAGPSLKVGRLAGQELRGERIVLPERAQTRDFLPAVEQVRLDGLAREAALADADSVPVRRSAQAPRATVRWWPLNRLDRGCGPVYTLSKPVLFRDAAFVTVTAGHRGSTYAFQKAGGNWSPVARWSTWLY